MAIEQPRQPLDLIAPSVAGLCRMAHRAIHAEVARRFAAAGFEAIHPPHFPLLRILQNHPAGVRSTAIAEQVKLTKASVKQSLDHLEHEGFVERVPDPSDGRAHLVRFTAKGRAFGAVGWPIVQAVEAEVEGLVGADAYPILKEALAKLAIAFEP